MAAGVQIGGLNVSIGADLTNFFKGLDNSENRLRDFNRKLSKIRLDAAIKGNPFADTDRYLQATKKEITSVYESWAANVNTSSNNLNKWSRKAQKNADKVIKKFQEVNEAFSVRAPGIKALDDRIKAKGVGTPFSALTAVEGVSGIGGKGSAVDNAIKKFREKVRTGLGLTEEEIVKDLKDIRKKVENEYNKLGKTIAEGLKVQTQVENAAPARELTAKEKLINHYKERRIELDRTLGRISNKHLKMTNKFNMEQTAINRKKQEAVNLEKSLAKFSSHVRSRVGKKVGLDDKRIEKKMIKQHAEATAKLRRENKELTIAIKAGIQVDLNRIKITKNLQDMKKRGIKLTKTEIAQQEELRKQIKETSRETKNVGAKIKGWAKTRAVWFLQLRLLWDAYRALVAAIKSVIEYNTELSRGLRTARSDLMSNAAMAKAYGQAMREAVSITGSEWQVAGEILFQLGSAGLSAEESLAGLNKTMKLVVGTEGSAQETTKAVAGIYNNFKDTIDGVTGAEEKLAMISDLLASAWQDHQVEMSELTDGFKQAGAMASAAGIKLVDLTAILSVANDNLIKGGRAGRSLSNILMRISRTPEAFSDVFDIEIDTNKQLDFLDIIRQLSEKFKDGTLNVSELSAAFERMGLRGAPLFAVLINNYDDLIKSQSKLALAAGSTERVMSIALDNVGKQAGRLVTNLKVIASEAEDVSKIFKTMFRYYSDMLEKRNEGAADRTALSGLVSKITIGTEVLGDETKFEVIKKRSSLVFKSLTDKRKKELRDYYDWVIKEDDKFQSKKVFGFWSMTDRAEGEALEATKKNLEAYYQVLPRILVEQKMIAKEQEKKAALEEKIRKENEFAAEVLPTTAELDNKKLQDLEVEKDLRDLIADSIRRSGNYEKSLERQRVEDGEKRSRKALRADINYQDTIKLQNKELKKGNLLQKELDGILNKRNRTQMQVIELDKKTDELNKDTLEKKILTKDIVRKIKEYNKDIYDFEIRRLEIQREMDERGADSNARNLAENRELAGKATALAKFNLANADIDKKYLNTSKGLKDIEIERLRIEIRGIEQQKRRIKLGSISEENAKELRDFTTEIADKEDQIAEIKHSQEIKDDDVLDKSMAGLKLKAQLVTNEETKNAEMVNIQKLRNNTLRSELGMKKESAKLNVKEIEHQMKKLNLQKNILANEAILLGKVDDKVTNQIEVSRLEKKATEANIDLTPRQTEILNDKQELTEEQIRFNGENEKQEIIQKRIKAEIKAINTELDRYLQLNNEMLVVSKNKNVSIKDQLDIELVGLEKQLISLNKIKDIEGLDPQTKNEVLNDISELEFEILQHKRNQRKETDMIFRITEKLLHSTANWADVLKNGLDTFVLGMKDGIAGILQDATGGFQQARQDNIDATAELKNLNDQKDEFLEENTGSDGEVFLSEEDLDRLKEMNKEIGVLEREITALEDPLKVMENAFREFFKGLIDSIRQAINEWIAMQIIMGVVKGVGGAFGGGTGDSGSISTQGVSAPGGGIYAATGGVIPSIKSFQAFSNGGTTGGPMMALLGDNKSGKELVIPSENISKDSVSGYTRDADGKTPITIVNLLNQEDILAVMAGAEGNKLVVNTIGADLLNRGKLTKIIKV